MIDGLKQDMMKRPAMTFAYDFGQGHGTLFTHKLYLCKVWPLYGLHCPILHYTLTYKHQSRLLHIIWSKAPCRWSMSPIWPNGEDLSENSAMILYLDLETLSKVPSDLLPIGTLWVKFELDLVKEREDMHRTRDLRRTKKRKDRWTNRLTNGQADQPR